MEDEEYIDYTLDDLLGAEDIINDNISLLEKKEKYEQCNQLKEHRRYIEWQLVRYCEDYLPSPIDEVYKVLRYEE